MCLFWVDKKYVWYNKVNDILSTNRTYSMFVLYLKIFSSDLLGTTEIVDIQIV